MGTKTITGAELFAVGTWNGITFTGADLDMIVSSFDTLGLSGRVPLKLGHEGPDARIDPETGFNKDPLDQLALGWVTRVYRDGDKLVSDWEVPDVVARLMSDGFLNHVSVEMLKNVQAGTRIIPWVLDAVALLGSDQPAVGILRDLKSLTAMARSANEFSHGGLATFARDDSKITYNFGDKSDMSDNASVTALAEKMGLMQVQLNDLAAENSRLKGENTTLKGTAVKLSSLEETVKQNSIKAHRGSIESSLEALVKSQEILPAVREKFIRVYKVADDDFVMDVTLEDVTSFAKNNANPHKKRETKKIVALSRATDDVPADTPADSEVVMRVEAQLRSEGKSAWTSEEFQNATVRLFRSNADLGERYKHSVNVAIDHPSARQ